MIEALLDSPLPVCWILRSLSSDHQVATVLDVGIYSTCVSTGFISHIRLENHGEQPRGPPSPLEAALTKPSCLRGLTFSSSSATVSASSVSSDPIGLEPKWRWTKLCIDIRYPAPPHVHTILLLQLLCEFGSSLCFINLSCSNQELFLETID